MEANYTMTIGNRPHKLKKSGPLQLTLVGGFKQFFPNVYTNVWDVILPIDEQFKVG